MAKATRQDRVDPAWPQLPDGEHPVSEIVSATQGAPSPFGELEFPLPAEQLPYEHPVTEINK